MFRILHRIAFGLFFTISWSYIAFAEDQNFLSSTVEDLIVKELPNEQAFVEVTFNSPEKVASIETNIENIKDVRLEALDNKSSNFRINITYNNGKADSLSGNYFPLVEVPVAAKYIKFNDTIQPTDIKTIKIRTDKVKRGYATDTSQVINMKAKRYIASGTMFNINDLLSLPVIKVNDPVNIIYTSGTISLKTVGTALGSGSIGDNIKVKNDSSGAVLLGEIINKNTVKVGGN